jgi:hypothetical protein
MSVQIVVYGAIMVNNRFVVHPRIGDDGAIEHVLPGGDISEHDTLPTALAALILEQIGHAVEVRELLWAGRKDDTHAADIILVFDVRLRDMAAVDGLTLIDPRGPEAARALPPVLRSLLFLRGSPCDAHTVLATAVADAAAPSDSL